MKDTGDGGRTPTGKREDVEGGGQDRDGGVPGKSRVRKGTEPTTTTTGPTG